MIGRVQLHELKPILQAHEVPRNQRRARIDAFLLGLLQHALVGGQQIGPRRCRLPQPQQAPLRLPGLPRGVGAEVVPGRPRMRIEHVERPRLRGHVAQHERIDGVLQHVGRSAGVEGVAIAQHAAGLTRCDAGSASERWPAMRSRTCAKQRHPAGPQRLRSSSSSGQSSGRSRRRQVSSPSALRPGRRVRSAGCHGDGHRDQSRRPEPGAPLNGHASWILKPPMLAARIRWSQTAAAGRLMASSLQDRSVRTLRTVLRRWLDRVLVGSSTSGRTALMITERQPDTPRCGRSW